MLADRALRSGYEGVGQDVNPYVPGTYKGSNFVPADQAAAVEKRKAEISAQIAAEKAAAAKRTTAEQQAVNKSNLGKTVYAKQDDGQIVGQKVMTSQYGVKPRPPADAAADAAAAAAAAKKKAEEEDLARRKAEAVAKAQALAPKPARAPTTSGSGLFTDAIRRALSRIGAWR